MSTAAILSIDCASLEQSLALAEQLGRMLRGQELIELAADLGGGKTTFVKGLSRGIGSNDQVTSPTFTISNQYQGARLTMHHYDFYRLGEAGIMSEALGDVFADDRSVVVIEWAGIVNADLPAERLHIAIAVTGELSRRYQLSATGRVHELLVQELRHVYSDT